MKKRRKKQKKALDIKLGKGILAFAAIVVISFALFKAIDVFKKAYKPNVSLKNDQIIIEIPSEAGFDDVINLLIKKDILIDTTDFQWLAKKMNYHAHINPGRYLIRDGMSNRELLVMLRAGRQVPVKVMFHNIVTLEQLAGVVGEQIETDSAEIIRLLEDEDVLESYGFNRKTIYAMFIPNTYEFFWNTGAKEFLDRMKSEYDKFWNKNRAKKLENIGFNKIEASTLASIVDAETFMNDEMPTIAGVFLNRLERGIRLQADPTIKFAVGNLNMRRVLKKHLEIDSPYNTYKIDGLPPGPISVPSVAAIDAVLNSEDHDYIYFAAKPDFSGYHNFSKTLQQHLQNAREYQRALNRQRIYE